LDNLSLRKAYKNPGNVYQKQPLCTNKTK
jgi:hypothetical protein